jgi:uncharacterized phiE125 gp8 family phage protein
MPLTKTRDYVSVQPTVEPVTIEEARLHLDLDDNYYDSQLKQLIEVSRKRVEQDSRRSFVNQTRVLKMDDFPGEVYIELPTAPVSSVTHVKYYDRRSIARSTRWTLTAHRQGSFSVTAIAGRVHEAITTTFILHTLQGTGRVGLTSTRLPVMQS